MNFLKDWSICVCITLIIATILSLISPNGRMGNLYKITISLFVFISFLYPLNDANFNFESINSSIETSIRYDDTISNMLKSEILSILEQNNISNSSVTIDTYQNGDEIEIKNVSVAVTDEYECDKVKDIIFENIGINAEVHKIGD